jgi:putative transposase
VRVAQARIDDFARRYEREFPTAVKCLLTDRQALTAYLRFPAEHHKRIRHTDERFKGRCGIVGRLGRG